MPCTTGAAGARFPGAGARAVRSGHVRRSPPRRGPVPRDDPGARGARHRADARAPGRAARGVGAGGQRDREAPGAGGLPHPRRRPRDAPDGHRPGVRHLDAAPAPAGRAAAGRRAQGALVAGARGGLPARARDQPDARGAPGHPAGGPGRLPARQPDPRVGQRGARPRPAPPAVHRAGRRHVRGRADRRAPADPGRTHAHPGSRADHAGAAGAGRGLRRRRGAGAGGRPHRSPCR